MGLDSSDFQRLGEVRDACRDTAKNTDKIADLLKDNTDATRALLTEIRDLGKQLTRRIDLIEEAIADPKSEAAKTLNAKYKRPAKAPGGKINLD